MRLGEIWWASLPHPVGSEPGYNRPVLVVQHDLFEDIRADTKLLLQRLMDDNETSLRTVIVAAITSNLRRADAPGNVRVDVADSNLDRPSVVNVTQLFTIGKPSLNEFFGVLPQGVMEEVDAGLKYVLDLRA